MAIVIVLLASLFMTGNLPLAAAVRPGEDNAGANGSSRGVENVFIVIIDGLRSSEGFDDPTHQYIPNIWNNLRPLGTIYRNFFNMGHPATTAGHAAITSGVTQFMHNTMTFNYGDLGRTQEDPSLFQYYREQLGIAKDKTWIINGKGRMIERTGISLHPYYKDNFEPSLAFTYAHNDDATWAETQRIIDTYKPSLALINLQDVDCKGHTGDWKSYTDAILHADTIVYDLFNKIWQDPHYQDNTVFIVTSDHGRHLDGVSTGFQDHGCSCLGCRRVPFLAVGAGIHPNVEVTRQGRLRDIAPTVAHLLGFDAVYGNGRILTDMLVSPPPTSFPGMCQPAVACGGGKVHLAATRHLEEFTQIFYANSSNNGQSWTGYKLLSTAKNNFAPEIAAEGSRVAVAWNTYKPDGASEIAFRESLDSGATWGPIVFFSGYDPLQPDHFPSVSYTQDIATIMWSERNQIHRARLQNGAVIGSDAFYSPGVSRPSFADAQPETHVVFQRLNPFWQNEEIFYCRHNGSGWLLPVPVSFSLGDSIHPDITLDASGIQMVWAESYKGEFTIVATKSLDGFIWDKPRIIDHAALGAWRPRIAASSNKLVIVWENYESDNAAIHGAFSMDGGTSWSAPIRIADTFNLDLTPAITVDPQDLMLLTWSMYGWPAALFDKTFQL